MSIIGEGISLKLTDEDKSEVHIYDNADWIGGVPREDHFLKIGLHFDFEDASGQWAMGFRISKSQEAELCNFLVRRRELMEGEKFARYFAIGLESIMPAVEKLKAEKERLREENGSLKEIIEGLNQMVNRLRLCNKEKELQEKLDLEMAKTQMAWDENARLREKIEEIKIVHQDFSALDSSGKLGEF